MKLRNKGFIEIIINFLLNILIFLFGIVLVVSIYTSFQTRILHKDYVDFFGYSIFEVQTGSMKPAIEAGDWIIIKLTNEIKLKDIVTYDLNKEYITHRVIEAYDDKYITKGDANNAKDKPISKKQVIGKVIKTIPSFGVLRNTIFNPPVLIALIITLFLFSFAFKKNKKNKNKEPDYLEELLKKVKLFIDDNLKSLKKEKVEIKEVIEKPIDEAKEEELEKTAVYRVIDVDNDPMIYEDDDIEDELDKTAMYRVISVDSSEIDKTKLEIAENEMKKANKPIKVEEQVKEEIIEEEPNNDLTDIDFELLNLTKGEKKGKNVIDTAMLIKKEELKKIFDVFISLTEDKVKPSIRDEYITVYVNTKYYNISVEDEELNPKNIIANVKKELNKISDILLSTMAKSNKKTINEYYSMFQLIASIEHAKDTVSSLSVRRGYYKEEIKKLFLEPNSDEIETATEAIIDIQKKYENTLNYFLEKLETNLFKLEYNVIQSKNNIYALNLVHNISFNRVYSDYIIDKTYTEGIVAEDKMVILLTLLSIQFIKNMLSSEFDKKYILSIPESLYLKEKKSKKIFKMMDDVYAEDSIYILIRFKDLETNFEELTELRKEGCKFVLVIEENDVLKDSDKGNMYLGEYIFIDKKYVSIKKVLPFIPDEMKNKIIYEDLEDKVGGFGGE